MDTMTDRPEGPFRERERALYDMQNPDPLQVIRELEKLRDVASEPLVSALDAGHVAAIASAAIKVIGAQLRSKR